MVLYLVQSAGLFLVQAGTGTVPYLSGHLSSARQRRGSRTRGPAVHTVQQETVHYTVCTDHSKDDEAHLLSCLTRSLIRGLTAKLVTVTGTPDTSIFLSIDP